MAEQECILTGCWESGQACEDLGLNSRGSKEVDLHRKEACEYSMFSSRVFCNIPS